MDPLISIIVPVYNVKPYLSRCVDSLLGQSYQNMELLLVDDGSTDGSEALCDEYAARDARVRVLHKKNGGLSDAHNAGVDAAKGEYLSFVMAMTGCHLITSRTCTGHWSRRERIFQPAVLKKCSRASQCSPCPQSVWKHLRS